MRTNISNFMSRCITLGALVALMGCGQSGSGSVANSGSSEVSSAREVAKTTLSMTAEESAVADNLGITTEELVLAASEIDNTPTFSKSVSKSEASDKEKSDKEKSDCNNGNDKSVGNAKNCGESTPVTPPVVVTPVGIPVVPSNDKTIPVVTEFVTPVYSGSHTIQLGSMTAIDNVGVVGYLVSNTSRPPALNDPRWTTTKPTSYTVPAGTLLQFMYLFARDSAGNISWARSAFTFIDVIPPKVSFFMLPAKVKGLTVPISFLIVSELQSGMAGYMITESNLKPAVDDPRWTPTKPASYKASSIGSKKLYMWAKDNIGNVSDEKSALVTIQ